MISSKNFEINYSYLSCPEVNEIYSDDEDDFVVPPLKITQNQNPFISATIPEKKQSFYSPDKSHPIKRRSSYLRSTEVDLTLQESREFPMECENVFPVNNYKKEEVPVSCIFRKASALDIKTEEITFKMTIDESEDEEERGERRNSILKYLEYQKLRTSAPII